MTVVVHTQFIMEYPTQNILVHHKFGIFVYLMEYPISIFPHLESKTKNMSTIAEIRRNRANHVFMDSQDSDETTLFQGSKFFVIPQLVYERKLNRLRMKCQLAET